MAQFGAGFFLFGFALAKLYKVVKKLVCGGDDEDIDPETGKFSGYDLQCLQLDDYTHCQHLCFLIWFLDG